MTNFNRFRLEQLIAIAVLIATLTACGKSENPPTVASPTSSPTPIAAASPKSSVAAVPPVETPVTVAVGSTSKTNAPAPSPVAAAPSAKTTEPTKTPNSPVSRTGICKGVEGAIITVETKNYVVAICGKGEPEFYVGMEKEDPTNSIRLPLTDFSPTFYSAVNGNTTYVLAKTPKGHFLTVTQGNKELLREVVSGWGN